MKQRRSRVVPGEMSGKELRAVKKELELKLDKKRFWNKGGEDLEAAFKVMCKQHTEEMKERSYSKTG